MACREIGCQRLPLGRDYQHSAEGRHSRHSERCKPTEPNTPTGVDIGDAEYNLAPPFVRAKRAVTLNENKVCLPKRIVKWASPEPANVISHKIKLAKMANQLIEQVALTVNVDQIYFG